MPFQMNPQSNKNVFKNRGGELRPEQAVPEMNAACNITPHLLRFNLLCAYPRATLGPLILAFMLKESLQGHIAAAHV